MICHGCRHNIWKGHTPSDNADQQPRCSQCFLHAFKRSPNDKDFVVWP